MSQILKLIIILRACARGKVIGLSSIVVVVHRKLGYFEIYKSKQVVNGTKLKIGEKLTYLCSYLFLTVHECDKL